MRAVRLDPDVSEAFDRMSRAVHDAASADGDPERLAVAFWEWDKAVTDVLDVIRSNG